MSGPVRVAVIDSGVNVPHPHLPRVAGGMGLDLQGRQHDDFVDRLGHGTAVAAAIHEKAPEAELFTIKVFESKLATSVPTLVRAVDHALAWEARIVNLSLGTPNDLRRAHLEGAVARVEAAGAILVSAREHDGVRWLPGCLPGVAGVLPDPEQERASLTIRSLPDGERALVASPFPRPIPGVPRERNLQGISFAVANASGVLAALLGRYPEIRTAEQAMDLILRTGDVGA
ncbi:MAG: S8 family serine peptidase [Gemmatimonadota bacterium]|nr:S8 family serine peptidase [Gemmatimonadota bacterium]